jgi:hypothetical protein
VISPEERQTTQRFNSLECSSLLANQTTAKSLSICLFESCSDQEPGGCYNQPPFIYVQQTLVEGVGDLPTLPKAKNLELRFELQISLASRGNHEP